MKGLFLTLPQLVVAPVGGPPLKPPAIPLWPILWPLVCSSDIL